MVLLSLRREEQVKQGTDIVLLSLRREEQGKVGLRYGPTKSSQRRVV